MKYFEKTAISVDLFNTALKKRLIDLADTNEILTSLGKTSLEDNPLHSRTLQQLKSMQSSANNIANKELQNHYNDLLKLRAYFSHVNGDPRKIRSEYQKLTDIDNITHSIIPDGPAGDIIAQIRRKGEAMSQLTNTPVRAGSREQAYLKIKDNLRAALQGLESTNSPINRSNLKKLFPKK
jgi:hypothetical protein